MVENETNSFTNNNEIKDTPSLPIIRPVENFHFPYKQERDPASWFEIHKYPILKGLTISSDDLRFNRRIAAGMLSEAWDRKRFMREEESQGANDVDRLYLITWLQHWSTFIGLLSATDARTIRALSENSQRSMVIDHFQKLITRKYPIKTIDEVAEETQKLKQEDKLVGIFHGSFAPPTWIHLNLANYSHQRCDKLIIGIDSDELVQSRKGKGRERYPFQDKYSVWSSFDNVADYVVEVPAAIHKDGEYDFDEIVNYYKTLGVGVVFFNKHEPQHGERVLEITAAGAIPFAEDVFGEGKVFSASQLMAMKESKDPYFVPILGKR